MKQSIYLETSVVGAYLDNGEPFRRDLTIRWWEHELSEYDVFSSVLVRREIERAIDYIGEHSPQGARNVAERFYSILLLLQDQPFAGPSNRYKSTRRLFLRPYPYLVHYKVTEAEIIILRFRHTSRKT